MTLLHGADLDIDQLLHHEPATAYLVEYPRPDDNEWCSWAGAAAALRTVGQHDREWVRVLNGGGARMCQILGDARTGIYAEVGGEGINAVPVLRAGMPTTTAIMPERFRQWRTAVDGRAVYDTLDEVTAIAHDWVALGLWPAEVGTPIG